MLGRAAVLPQLGRARVSQARGPAAPSVVDAGGAIQMLYGPGPIRAISADPSKVVASMNACAPIMCSCCEFWPVRPGTTSPLTIDWSRWLNSVPGFNGISRVLAADLSSNIPGEDTVDPLKIKLTSGFTPELTPEEPPGWAYVDGATTQVLVSVAPDVPIGTSYRLDMTVQAVDCGRRAITANSCVIISIQLC